MAQLPPKPNFAAIEAAAPKGAGRRMVTLGLIGNLVYCWSNNESLFIYILMLLMEADEASAAVVFGTLNTTRARIDLIERLAKLKIRTSRSRRSSTTSSSGLATPPGSATSSIIACTWSTSAAK